MTGRRATATVLAAAALLLASCTTVPNSSAPQVIKSVDNNPQDQPQTFSPPPGAEARTIVEDFLEANAINDLNHNSSRSFLTPEEKGRWSDSTIIVVDRTQVSNPARGTVTVTGNEIGAIDETGVYTPSLLGDGTGTGGVPVSRPFVMKRIKGEWRIDSLQKGLLITAAQFQRYQQRKVYFFDGSEEHLVPDPRYTQLTDPRDLAVWLVSLLAQGPRGGLATGLPAQTDPKRVRVAEFPSDGDGPIKIEVPGAGQLDTGNLDRLGAQIAATLGQVVQLGNIEITDGGTPVRIPAVGGTVFTAQQLHGQFAVNPPPLGLYYVEAGAVYRGSGRRLPGKVGAGVYGLTSVALTPRLGSNTLQIAGVRGAGKNEFLDVGTADQLVSTKIHGELSRPAWAPDANEVWIGVGKELMRVSASAPARAHVVPVDAPGGKATGTVTAVRLSPEGSRVALVLNSPGTSAQVYVGAVVRNSTGVRVANLTPISPQGITVTDVAWNDELKLFTIGKDQRTNAWDVYEVQCDGSQWTPRGTAGLPGAPDSVTVASSAVAVVSTDGTVERQEGGAWGGLVGDETHGTNPVYVE